MPLDHASEPLELLGVGVVASLTPECQTFLGEGLLQAGAGKLRGLHHLGPYDLQKPAVHGVGDGLLLGGAVDHHQGRPEQVRPPDAPPFPVPTREVGSQGGFDPIPGQALGQGGQRVLQVDHLVQAGAEKSAVMELPDR